jgi:molybdopterin/thiamine biosynthesis adenylyltransferase
MTKYVVVHRGNGEVPKEEIQKIQERAGVKVLNQRRDSLFLVEFAGSAEELLDGLDNAANWIASEQRTYSFA